MEPFLAEYLLGRTRCDLLRALLDESPRAWTVGELKARTRISEAALRRELHALRSLGLLECSRDTGACRNYKVDGTHPAARTIRDLVLSPNGGPDHIGPMSAAAGKHSHGRLAAGRTALG